MTGLTPRFFQFREKQKKFVVIYQRLLQSDDDARKRLVLPGEINIFNITVLGEKNR